MRCYDCGNNYRIRTTKYYECGGCGKLAIPRDTAIFIEKREAENARLREAYKRLKALVMAWATYSYDDIPDTAKIKIAYGSADDEASTTFGEIRKAIEGGES